MDASEAINVAVGCVMASGLSFATKQEVINVLRELEPEEGEDE